MSFAYSVLGQVEPSATTLTTLYTVPASTQAVISVLTIANKGVTTPVRVAVRPDGEAIADKHYLLYDVSVDANDALIIPLGLTISHGDVISVYAGTADVSFNVYGATEAV